MFADEGIPFITGSVVVVIALVVVGFAVGGWAHWPALAVAALFAAFTLYFFRDPERITPDNSDDCVIAPADGKIVEIVEESDDIYVNGPALRISIFLSPLDVHVNRVPANGTVEYVHYVPGDYLVAWHPKASEKNERSEIGLRHTSGTPILFKQIAGAVARRIVYRLSPGDEVLAGFKYGIVKFGSRMDVVVPAGSLDLEVEVGNRVRAGESILGRLVNAL